MESGPGTADPIQNSMGEIGRWHILVTFLIFFCKFPMAFHTMAIIFLAPPADYTCDPAESEPGKAIDKCSSECNKQYNRSVFTETIITEFDLVCEKRHYSNMSQLIVMFGVLVGNLSWGVLSDIYGRRIPLVAAGLIQLISGIITSYSVNFSMFCVFRFITAVVTGGTMVSSFVLLMELYGAKYRLIVTVLYQIPFVFGLMLLSAFSYGFRDWHHFNLAISIPSIILISYYWLLPESPRWLFAIDQVDEAVKVLTKAAKYNKLPTDRIQANIENYYKERSAAQTEPNVKANSFDLFRTPNLRLTTISMCILWFSCGLTTFGVAQYIGQLGGDIFVNVPVGAVIAIPGTLFCIYSLKAFGRKLSVICSTLSTGVTLLVIAFVPPSHHIIIVVLAGIADFFVAITFSTCYLYSGELFPTVVRNVGVGLSSMMARVGSMIAPFIVGLHSIEYFIPPIVFGVVSIIGAILVFLLPETRNTQLPDTIEEGENLKKKNKTGA